MRDARRVFTLSVVVAAGLTCLTGLAAERESPYGSGVVKLVSTEWLQNHLKDANLIIVDAQTDVYDYLGQHIPGAISLPWKSLMADDNPTLLKSDEQIAEILKKHNITPDQTIITYCGTGREATNPFLLFKCYLGYSNVKLYEGSFTEWSAYPDNPTVVGPNPK